MIFKTGEKYNLTFVVSEAVQQSFVQTFGDKNPLHTDEVFARTKGFKGKVMHGNILNGFLSYFIGEGLPVKNVIIHSQEIQFKNPVYMEDELDFTATVSDVFESVKSVEFKFVFTNTALKTVAKGKIQIGLLA
ncbi:MAG: MaoC/PaaZ C-terminal domain-containing protein [Ferruginibacter sp.]